MAPRRYKDAHRVCIYEEPNPGNDYSSGLPPAITDPINHLDQVYWHSDLNYREIFYNQVIMINFPARAYPPGSQKWSLPAHNLGSLPRGVLLVGNTQIPTGEPIQGANQATRHVALGVDETNIWIREVWNYSSLSAITFTFRAILVRPATLGASSHLADESPTRVVYGGGKFDTNKQYLRHAPAPATPDFYMTNMGRTIDTTNAGYRGVRPNGVVKEFNAYTGSFAGAGFIPVAR